MDVLFGEDSMAISKTLYASRSEEWPNPQSFFDQLDAEFGFTLDASALADNAKCPLFISKKQDGLKSSRRSNLIHIGL
jgi:hypothetical protein